MGPRIVINVKANNSALGKRLSGAVHLLARALCFAVEMLGGEQMMVMSIDIDAVTSEGECTVKRHYRATHVLREAS